LKGSKSLVELDVDGKVILQHTPFCRWQEGANYLLLDQEKEMMFSGEQGNEFSDFFKRDDSFKNESAT
jgi:hypothetical protein